LIPLPPGRKVELLNNIKALYIEGNKVLNSL